jgi:hypothetical protein
MFRTRWALATLLAACLLGGCSDDDPEPKVGSDPTPSESSSTLTVSASPTVTSATPAVSPEDVVRNWVAARNAALRSGDTAQLRSLTDVSCGPCVSLITSIEEVYADGGSYDTEGWTVKSAKARDPDSSRPTVDAAVVVAGGTTIDAAGADPVTYGPENHIMLFKLHLVDGRPLIDFVGFVS